jgi:hypothetical protein
MRASALKKLRHFTRIQKQRQNFQAAASATAAGHMQRSDTTLNCLLKELKAM